MNNYTWGNGTHGRLGLGDERDRLEPTLLTPNTDEKFEWIQIECGGGHTFGLTKKGEVFTWVGNGHGELGHAGDEENRSVPTKVENLDGIFITKISCGQNHAALLTDKGELLTWGCGFYGRLGHDNRWRHNNNVDDDDNDEDDESRDDELIPRKVEAFLADEVIIVDVACGEYHTCAVTSTGSIFTWGLLGTHEWRDVTILPTRLKDFRPNGVVSVSAHFHFTACATRSGEVFTWGRGERGKLGHGDTRDYQTPKRVEALVDVKVTIVSCGRYHTAVCTGNGHMYTFGHGGCGQLGHGDKENRSSPVLVQALLGKHITQVQCGWCHTMALTSSGDVFTWGDAMYGALGHGNVNLKYFSIPCLVEGLREHNVVQMSTHHIHCAVLVDPSSPSDIRQSQQASCNKQEHSDVVFMVENQPLYASIEVLSQKSDYFAAMFRSSMRESIEKVVQMPNCSSATFLHVLEYLYLDDFAVSIDDVVELWSLADMYQMEGLKYSCMGALERGLSVDNVSEILEELEDLSCPCDELKRICHEHLQMMK